MRCGVCGPAGRRPGHRPGRGKLRLPNTAAHCEDYILAYQYIGAGGAESQPQALLEAGTEQPKLNRASVCGLRPPAGPPARPRQAKPAKRSPCLALAARCMRPLWGRMQSAPPAVLFRAMPPPGPNGPGGGRIKGGPVNLLTGPPFILPYLFLMTPN